MSPPAGLQTHTVEVWGSICFQGSPWARPPEAWTQLCGHAQGGRLQLCFARPQASGKWVWRVHLGCPVMGLCTQYWTWGVALGGRSQLGPH